MNVKICGITNLEDALMAADLGAGMLGFIFVKQSPRYISPPLARQIISKLPPSLVTVGVFADAPRGEVSRTIQETGIQCLQFHGEETQEQCLAYPLPVWKAFRVHPEFSLEQLRQYSVAAYLLDTYVEGFLGGTGKVFDWNKAVAAKTLGKIVLSGGINVQNVYNAILTVQPYAIDTSSGVESSPGKKDRQKLLQLFEQIHKAEQEIRN